MRLGGLKYLSPMRYMGTKLIANAIYSTLVPRGMGRTPRCLDLTRHQVTASGGSAYANARAAMEAATEELAMPESRTPAPRVESLAEWQPVFRHAPGRPAAVKRNGGLRGSMATRW